jgi:hypothetical protein
MNMKKLLLTGIAVLFLATGTAHAAEDYCAVVLKPPAKVVRDKEYNSEAWLALRDGPGTQFMIMGKLRMGDFLHVDTDYCLHVTTDSFVCDKQEWTHVIGIPRYDGADMSPRQGWVRSKYIQIFTCELEQARKATPWLPPPEIQ